jgi:hypothetical protein
LATLVRGAKNPWRVIKVSVFAQVKALVLLVVARVRGRRGRPGSPGWWRATAFRSAWRTRHLVFPAHLPHGLHRAAAHAEQDNLDRAPPAPRRFPVGTTAGAAEGTTAGTRAATTVGTLRPPAAAERFRSSEPVFWPPEIQTTPFCLSLALVLVVGGG